MRMRLFGVYALWPLVGVGLLMAPCLSAQPQVDGCPVFPADNIWNVRVDGLPVDPNSARYIESNDPTRNLHPDFGPGGGIPYGVVPEDQPLVKVTFTGGAAESDPGPYPIPPDLPLEGGSDRHGIVLQQGVCKLYELFALNAESDGRWVASSGALFDLKSNALRPDGWTSADAAGLPILPGLVRYEEVASGEIKHALRVTVPKTRREYIWPARHFASRSDDSALPPMGQRFRLKADYDISGFPVQVQVILRAIKEYGLILSDNGSSWFITGTRDSRWDNDVLAALKKVHGSDLEAVDVSSLMINPNSGQAGKPVVIGRTTVPFSATPTFDLSAGTVQSITLKDDVVSSDVTGLADGQTVSFLICQDEVGLRRFSWSSKVQGGMEVGTSPNSCSAQQFVSDGNRLYATSPGVSGMPNQ